MEGTEDLREEYHKADQKNDYEHMATIIKQGLPASVLIEDGYRAFKRAIGLMEIQNNYTLVDALLSRKDIRDMVMKELVFKGRESLKFLQYLESRGADIGKICFESEADILTELLDDYSLNILNEGKERCDELCAIIDFLKSRGVDTVRAYKYLADDALVEEDRHDCLNLPGDCYDQVARRLKPKGGKQWKRRDW